MGGGKKNANFELNLVPYIDLMSTLICFLLMTAVWQELDAMSTNAPPKMTSETSNRPQPAPPPDPKKVMLTVSLEANQVSLYEDEKSQVIQNASDGPDIERVILALKGWKAKFPERKDVLLATDNKAKYKYLVQMMDTLIAQEFPDVGINLN